jgi:hypothetical protein
MSCDDGRLTGDPAENVGQIVDLLEVLKRLDPSLESEVRHSCWLRELAALHERRDAKEPYRS